MGRGGQGGGSRNPANQPREVQISRKLSWLLRHGAASEKLKLGKGGYVNVQEALNTRTLKALNVTFPELCEIVATNDKQRYSMISVSALSKDESVAQETSKTEPLASVQESDDPADYLIRANQGHSVKVDNDGLLTPITEEAGNIPSTVVHGTDEPAWHLIIKGGGLRPMGRNHIHFASGLPAGSKPMGSSEGSMEEKEAAPVISGMRKNSSILIFIDIQAALAAGIKFHISENGVILTEGNTDGLVPYEFFKRVESRKKDGGVLMSNGILPEGTVVNVEDWKKQMAEVKGKGKRSGRGVRSSARGGRGGKASDNDDSRDLMAGI